MIRETEKQPTRKIEPVFVDTIPEQLEDGRLYIALKYRTVTHKCACGCGVEINTPLHPTGWSIIYDGARISLWPSVGNWSEECRSHYWIDKNRISWSRPWTREEILVSRNKRLDEIKEYYETAIDETKVVDAGKSTQTEKKNLPGRLIGWLRNTIFTFLDDK